jgi:hypothetical protein
LKLLLLLLLQGRWFLLAMVVALLLALLRGLRLWQGCPVGEEGQQCKDTKGEGRPNERPGGAGQRQHLCVYVCVRM